MAAVGSLGVSLPAPLERTVGLSRTADGDVVPTASRRARLRARDRDPFIAWIATVAVTLLAAFLRLWELGKPRSFLFDETYYAKDAWSLIHNGYSLSYVEKANQQILDGKTSGLWTDTPNMVVHPEVGKWLIGLGESALRDGPVRLAGRLGDRRLTDGAGDDPPGSPGHPLHDARPGRRAS